MGAEQAAVCSMPHPQSPAMGQRRLLVLSDTIRARTSFNQPHLALEGLERVTGPSDWDQWLWLFFSLSHLTKLCKQLIQGLKRNRDGDVGLVGGGTKKGETFSSSPSKGSPGLGIQLVAHHDNLGSLAKRCDTFPRVHGSDHWSKSTLGVFRGGIESP